MAKKKTETEQPKPETDQGKPLFKAPCKFGGTSFGAETVSVGVKFLDSDIPERFRPMFIKQQLKVRISMDPNPTDQPILEGMEDPYDSAVGISTFSKISVGDKDVSTRLKFPINAINSEFMVNIACQSGSLQVLEIIGSDDDDVPDLDITEDDEE